MAHPVCIRRPSAPPRSGRALGNMSGMNLSARLRCFAIPAVAAVLAILALELYRLLPPLRRPITVDIVGFAQNSSNLPVVVVRVANQTPFNFACALWTEVLSNGVWIDALTQYPEARMANYFPAGHKSAVQVPVPMEGDSERGRSMRMSYFHSRRNLDPKRSRPESLEPRVFAAHTSPYGPTIAR